MRVEAERVQFTPGPWRAGGNHVFAVTRSGREQWIASTDSPYVSAEEPLSNGRLIAAAPDLLAALKNIVPRFERCMIAHKNSPEIAAQNVKAARAAIAKAEGRNV